MTADEERTDESRDPRKPGPAELEALFARNLHHVRAFVRLRLDADTRDKEAVSDIVQSACREVLANENFEYRGEAEFRSYLCQAALHKIRGRRRHHQAQKRRAPKAQPLDSEVQLANVYRTTFFEPQRAAIRSEEIEQLEAAFERLPPDYREALTLYRIGGMSVSDLAQHLGRTPGATQTLLSRAMARLTSVLGGKQPRDD